MNQKHDNCGCGAARSRTRETSCCCNNTDNGEAEAIRADAIEERADTRQRRACDFSDPVCINSDQIYDSCRDRDCVVNQRVYLTEADQALIDQAINIKLKSAEVIWVFTDVEPLSFTKGYYTVDLKFFVMTTLEVFTGISNPTIIKGLTMYDKRVALYGSEGNTKVFTSKYNLNDDSNICETWRKTSMPTVTVEVADPVALTADFADDDDCCCDCGCSCSCDSYNPFPTSVCDLFDGDLVVSDDVRQVMVTYGLFFIVRLERETQLLIDAIDFCIPTHECPAATDNEPCSLFNDIRFPIDEFFPPRKSSDTIGNNNTCGCTDSRR